MSWTEIKPPVRSAGKRFGDITLSASEGTGQLPRRVTVSVRTEALPDLQFFRAGERVKAMLGHGEQAGILRIMPGGAFLLRLSGGKVGQCPLLVLPEISGMAKGRFARTDVEFDYGGEGAGAWLEITLPNWARPAVKQGMPIAPTPAAPAAPAALVTRPAGAPFRGQLASQPHDMKRGS